MHIIVAITGASGVIYGKRLLEVLQGKHEVHLITSKTSHQLLKHELGLTKDDLRQLADHAYDEDDLTAPLSSGSFLIDAMVIVPCSMKTLAGIAHGYSENLILRAADVTLKEQRKLILVPRETPLTVIHLRNLLELAALGVIILPAMPAFYPNPTTIDALIDFVVGKILDALAIPHSLFKRWSRN
jgi:4-hydroxy-3-polyprenylbenzoate decarboxylase